MDKKRIDVKFLQSLIKEEKFRNITINWISSSELEKYPIYQFSLKTFKDDDLVTHFSPEVNLLGELISEILADADVYGSYILMAGNHLITELKNHISIFLNATDEFMNIKSNFFHTHIPGLLLTRGVRWGIGIISNAISFSKNSKRKFTLSTFALSVFDP